MADGPRLLARRLDIDRSPVLHVLLRQVEEVARGIVGADAREGARAGALQDFDRGVALAQSRADPFGVLHLHAEVVEPRRADRKSTRLNSSHTVISYAVFCLKKKK